MDKRTALNPNRNLTVYETEQETGAESVFFISDEIGRGGSCIVYRASYTDAVNSTHAVRLKEFYPCRLSLARNECGRLCPSDGQETLFYEEKKRFIGFYKSYVEISQKENLSNLTIHGLRIYYANQTVYAVMDCKGGISYGEITKETLPEAIERGYAVARALREYHRAGCLHLDIKPENIWIIPETNQMIHLFDFDSVIPKERLPFLRPGFFSYTKGFAAPELIAGDPLKIGETTDVYGLGALLFYRLTGRCPTRQDREYLADYPLEQLIRDNPRIRPLFFRRLKQFFHKTLAAARFLRYPRMEDAVAALEELVALSDPKAVYPIPNFFYHQGCFVGRKEELSRIRQRLTEKHLLFLHGIGGIGKTELAMGYAHQYADVYDTVFFLRVESGILDALSSNELTLSHFFREKNETGEEYARRKLAALKDSLSADDLLILDNFDLEEDALLEDFTSLPCQLLITSRCDFSDWNYPQMEVGALCGMEELLELFSAYAFLEGSEGGAVSKEGYTKEEWEAVRSLICLVEGHTMLTELLAKNLRVSGEMPSALLKKLQTAEGVYGATKDLVRHRKDQRRLKASVQDHMKALFDSSRLSANEKYLLANLSLFAGVRILARRFLEWCGKTDLEQTAENLVLRGWIEGGSADEKLSLHPVVLDLMYRVRQEEHISCARLTQSMTAYAAQTQESCAGRETKERMCEIFGQRLLGREEETLDFYLVFCEKIRCQKQWLAVCKETFARDEARYARELARVYRVKGEEAVKKLGRVELILKERLQRQAANEALECLRQAASYMENASCGEGMPYGMFLFSMGSDLYRRAEAYLAEEDILVLLDFAALEWMERGVRICESDPHGDREALQDMYEELMDFYDPDAFVPMRPEQFGDTEKRLFYAKKREALLTAKARWEAFAVDLRAVSYTEAGLCAEREEDWQNTVRYLTMALQNGEADALFYETKIGFAYEKMGELKKALSFFLELYKGKEDLEEISCAIGRLYRKTGDLKRAHRYLKESRRRYQELIPQNEPYAKAGMLQAYRELSLLPGKAGVDALREGLEFYGKERETLAGDWETLPFLLRYAKAALENGASDDETAARLLCDAGRLLLDRYGEEEARKWAFRRLKEVSGRLPDTRLKAEALCICAEMTDAWEEDSLKEQKEYYEQALGILCKAEQRKTVDTARAGRDGFVDTAHVKWEESVDAMRVRHRLSEVCELLGMGGTAREYAAACDYGRIAQEETERILRDETLDKAERLAEQTSVWTECGDRFWNAGRLEQAADCFRRAEAMWRMQEASEQAGRLGVMTEIMARWAALERFMGNAAGGGELLERWYWELTARQAEERPEDSDAAYAFLRLGEAFGELGDKSRQAACVLWRGLAELGTGEKALEGESLKQLAERFVKRVWQGIDIGQTDAVLAVCDEILALYGEDDAADAICGGCRKVIRRYREGEVAFR